MSDDNRFHGHRALAVAETHWSDIAEPQPCGQDSLCDHAVTPLHDAHEGQLVALTELSSLTIETSLVSDLSDTLHDLFDHVSNTTLPIYFGPLLGRLYLEGL